MAETEWEGPNPFVLLIMPSHGREGAVYIDLDVAGWTSTHSELMRAPGHWHLIHKEQERETLTLIVHDGEQPYYTARHTGIAGSNGSNEVIAYGIGKKCSDGSMVRLWSMPDGHVVGGDDVDEYAILLVKALGPR
jgi:hypothetical protein